MSHADHRAEDKKAFLPTHGYESLMKTRRPEIQKKGPGKDRSPSETSSKEPLIPGETIEIWDAAKNKWVEVKVIGKAARLTEELDILASEIEKEDPRIALAMDLISDRLESVLAFNSVTQKTLAGIQDSAVSAAEEINKYLLHEKDPEVKSQFLKAQKHFSDIEKECIKLMGKDVVRES